MKPLAAFGQSPPPYANVISRPDTGSETDWIRPPVHFWPSIGFAEPVTLDKYETPVSPSGAKIAVASLVVTENVPSSLRISTGANPFVFRSPLPSCTGLNAPPVASR
ncbi:unannotated protein [freshwater metagenome]|uniref:Unannotated protein n=1 Tax=freshwater metagenome TaxID=449393 RepID=A0A6J6H232_9ZZZZ